MLFTDSQIPMYRMGYISVLDVRDVLDRQEHYRRVLHATAQALLSGDLSRVM